jgi:hypothetical protein
MSAIWEYNFPKSPNHRKCQEVVQRQDNKKSRSLSLVCLHCRKSQSQGPVVCMCAKVPFLSGCEVNIPCDGALLFWANSLSVTQKSSSFLSAS